MENDKIRVEPFGRCEFSFPNMDHIMINWLFLQETKYVEQAKFDFQVFAMCYKTFAGDLG